VKRFVFFVLFALAGALSFAQEISLFDYNGRATAYIAGDGNNTIYLWNGRPVAYIFFDKGDYHIYGFNGRHLGWFDEGIVRDNRGEAVGAEKSAHPKRTRAEPEKSAKREKPVASLRGFAPIKPVFSKKWSKTSLNIMLSQGYTPGQ